MNASSIYEVLIQVEYTEAICFSQKIQIKRNKQSDTQHVHLIILI